VSGWKSQGDEADHVILRSMIFEIDHCPFRHSSCTTSPVANLRLPASVQVTSYRTNALRRTRESS
jgi:hypothetical protein